MLNRKMMLITGGTGTVGQEMTKQLDTNNVIIFSRNEVAQVKMARKYPNVEYVIGDVRDYDTLKHICRYVDTIYHLAAIKHITICEKQPEEAIKTNVYGTINVMEAASRHNCRVKFLSTDKAECPTCVYGNTKAIAESIVLRNGGKIIRSGNIFGSSGSVIPLFKKQLEETNKITLTNGEMTRYFTSVKDLVNVIIKCNRDINIPEIDSFTMLSVAKMAIKMWGNEDSDIVFIGNRQGEKLHEMLGGVSSANCVAIDDRLLQLFKTWEEAVA